MMNEQLVIAKIRAMTDVAEVDKQLEEVRQSRIKITAFAQSELANVREWLNSSPLFTREDLDEELQNLDLTQKLKTTQRTLDRFQEELIKRKEQLTNQR
jgi:flagellar motility protein MotE (MotC chaperone)